MPSALRSQRQEHRQLSAELRAQHKTWVEIAAAFCERNHVNMRAALRMVRDWSQRDAAERWNGPLAGRFQDFQELLVLGELAERDRLRTFARRARPPGRAL